jgi:hypothetical protein
MNPKIKEYMRQRGLLPDGYDAAENEQAGAEKMQDMMGYAKVAGQMADGFANASNQDLILANKRSNLGGRPNVVEAKQQNTDFSLADSLGNDRQARAKAKLDAMKEEMRAGLQNEQAGEKAKAVAEKEAWERDYKNRELDSKSADRKSNDAYRNAMLGATMDRNNIDRQFKVDDRAKKDAALNIPGYSRTGEVTPTENEAKDARTAVGIQNNLKRGIQDLKTMIQKNGSFEYGGADGATMASIANDLRLQAKELYNLGVLNGPDLGILLKQIPDTDSMSAMFTRDGTAQAQLDAALNALQSKTDEGMKARGYLKSSPKPVSGPRDYNSMSDEELMQMLNQGK